MRRQKGVPLEHWPQADLIGFKAGYLSNRRSDPGWMLGQHSQTTKKGLISGYSCSLGWLADRGLLRPEESASARWSRMLLTHMVADMMSDHTAAAVTFRLRATRRVISIIEPCADLSNFDDAIAGLPRVGPARKDFVYKVGIKDLVRFGLELMAEAETSHALSKSRRALLYQTGLQILWLILRPWRSTAFGGVQLGRELTNSSGQWRLIAPDTQTLHKKSANAPFPRLCIQPLDSFLTVWRPELQPDPENRALWSRPDGRHFDWSHLHYNICKHTTKKFGEPFSPKWFRKIVATTIGRDLPELIHIAKEVLGHSHPSMTAEFYDLAQSVLAFNALDDCIDEL